MTDYTGARETVYRRIAMNPGVNNTDISVMLGWTINRVTPRVRELLDQGRIEVVGYKKSQFGVRTKCYAPVTVDAGEVAE